MKQSLVLTLLLSGCATYGTETAQPRQVEESRNAAKSLTAQLGGKLKAEIGRKGPASAVGVCKEIAPQIAASLSRETGGKVGRVGTRAQPQNRYAGYLGSEGTGDIRYAHETR